VQLIVEPWDLTKTGEWDHFLRFYTAYLKEVEGIDSFKEQEDIVTSLAYHDHILALNQRSDPPFVIASLLKDGAIIGFAEYRVFPLEHRKSFLDCLYLVPEERGKGYGSYFYDEIEKDLLRLDARYVDLTAGETSLGFFTHKDFQKTNDHSLENHRMCYRKFLPRAFDYKKILVLGSPGAGKSYFSSQLAQAFSCPIVHMDMLYWKPNWEHVSDEEMRHLLDQAMAGERWIIDGNYASTLEYRYQKADIVFFLDYPPELCLQGEKERRGHPREDFPSFLTEGEDPNFLKFIASFPKVGRFVIVDMAEKYIHTSFVRFSSREECNQFLSLYKRGH
jgi:GNAT superfamily N-acetyltransferase